MVKIDGDLMTVTFGQPFSIEAYDLFLKTKRLPEFQLERDEETYAFRVTAPARFAGILGLRQPRPAANVTPFPSFLFEHQREILRLALDAKRYAVWSDVGTGKTLIELEYARQVATRTGGGRSLIVTLNEIVDQTIEEAKRFYGDSLPIRHIRSRAEMRVWCAGPRDGAIAITNYEKFNPDEEGQEVNELRFLGGLILDESSRLKAGGGKQKWALIKSSRGIPYKLSATATPAPNDVIEFASQASFLERMRSDNEIIWTFFTRDPATQEWTVKRHARAAFFEWMAAWSIYLRDPRRYGWSSTIKLPPKPVMIYHKLPIRDAQLEEMKRYTTEADGQQSLFAIKDQGIVGRTKFSQIAKGFVYEGDNARRIDSAKPAFIADLIEKEAKLNPLVWTVFDEEGDIIAEELRARGFDRFEVLSGATPKARRQEILDDYRKGKTPVLISKGKLLGYGMNFQHCRSMIFSGWNDSFEEFYQEVGRAVRYGQKRAVRIHLPFIEELERAQLDNVLRKAGQFEELVREQESAYIAAMNNLQLITQEAA
jgi:superfamily II DNA or RNA helicase